MRSNPKFSIARAAAPIFSPICGRTRTKLGCGVSLGMEVVSENLRSRLTIVRALKGQAVQALGAGREITV
jgi:hypothetical protein